MGGVGSVKSPMGNWHISKTNEVALCLPLIVIYVDIIYNLLVTTGPNRFSKSGTTDFDPNGPLTLINKGLHRIHNRSLVSHFSPIMDARSVLRKKAIPLTEASFLIVNWQEKEERCSDRSWG